MAFNLDSAWKVAQTIFGIADVSRRVLRPGDSPQQPGSDLETAGGGLLGHVEARLTGVVISALKEAFDRDAARLMDVRDGPTEHAGGRSAAARAGAAGG